MMRIQLFLSALTICLVAIPAAGADKKLERLYVMPIELEGVEPAVAKRIESLVITRLSAYKAVDLISASAAKSILAKSRTESALSEGQCEKDDSCLKDLGRILHSDLMLRMSAIGLRSRLLINAEMVRPRKGSIIKKVEWEMAVPLQADDESFVQALDDLIGALDLKGNVMAVSEAPGATLKVGREDFLIGDNERVKFDLPLGTHIFVLTHPDYLDYTEQVFVPVGRTIWEPDHVTKEEVATPWYASWWFWTGAAVLVGGGVATWISLQPEDNQPDPLPTADFGTLVVRF